MKKNKNKKRILIGIGSITSLVLPIATVLSCGNSDTTVQLPKKNVISGKISGDDHHASYTPVPLSGTVIKDTYNNKDHDHNDDLADGDKVTISYTLKKGDIWSDNTTGVKKSYYTVSKLNIGVKKPTKSTAKVTFTGDEGSGTFTMPKYTGTIVTIKGGGKIPTTLRDGNKITLIYTPDATHAWTDASKKPTDVTYTVSGLKTKVQAPNKTTTSGTMAGNEGSGKYTLPTLTGTNITATYKTKSGTATLNSHLSNSDIITLTYKLKTGYAWSNNTTVDKTSTYTVKTLKSVWHHNTRISGLTNKSNITSGRGGTIFQDKDGNIWSMAAGTPLQVLAKGAKTWVNSTTSGLTNGSNITDGYDGTIFEDTNGNIWSMGHNATLQVLKAGTQTWVNSTTSGLTKGSNITDSSYGTIFEDTKGNIWSMGDDTPLQVLANDAKTWVNSTTSGLTKGSNITDGSHGNIIQDKAGNIWSMAYNTPLQVLANDAKTWVNSTTSGLTNGSNITNGDNGSIFQDKSGNIWSMGSNTPLQVLTKGAKGTKTWVNSKSKSPGLTKESNIINGIDGTIFEDTNGNIWSMGYDTPLQVLKAGTQTWVNSTTSGLTKGSDIIRGETGTIFQDKDGNIWSMGYDSGLQVLNH